MARYHGKRGRLYMGATAAPVASLNKWTLDLSTDRADTTCFEDGNKTSVQGYPAYKGTFGGFWDDTDDAAFDAVESTTAVKMYLYPSLDAVSKYFYGTAWVDVSIATGTDGAVTTSGNFEAAGTWGRQ